MKKRTLSHGANILTLTVTVHHRSFATKTYLEKKKHTYKLQKKNQSNGSTTTITGSSLDFSTQLKNLFFFFF